MHKPSAAVVASDQGAVAVLVAASLIMLMGFAALVVDVGAAMSERRQDQSAADMAALAAVQFARGSANPATAANNGASVAITVANSTLDNPAAANWATCSDPNRPTEFTRVSTVSACVSFTANLQRSRVVIPTIEVATTFGRVLGRASISASAFAEAQGDLGQEGRVLPFGLPGGSANQTEVCLRAAASTNMTPPPCNGPEQGNFGTLEFAIYGNPTVGTIEDCRPNPQQGLSTNMAAGIDHPLGIVDGQVRRDDQWCPIFNARPNHIFGQTGVGSNLDDGMLDGSSYRLTSPMPGRLARGGNRLQVERNTSIDNTPLWSFINSGSNRPASCVGVNNTARMAACIADWRSGSYSDPLFTLAIGDAIRFGAVPQLTSNTWGNGRQLYGIANIVPIYLQGTYWRCQGNGSCTIVHYPGDPGASSGVGSTVNGNNKLSAVTAFLLHIDMLPEPLRSNFPSTAGQIDYALTR